jgi:hypothetical protein
MACRWSAAEVLYFPMQANGVTGDLGRGVKRLRLVAGLPSFNSSSKENKAMATTRLGMMSKCTAMRQAGLEEVKATGVGGQRLSRALQELVSAGLGLSLSTVVDYTDGPGSILLKTLQAMMFTI